MVVWLIQIFGVAVYGECVGCLTSSNGTIKTLQAENQKDILYDNISSKFAFQNLRIKVKVTVAIFRKPLLSL